MPPCAAAAQDVPSAGPEQLAPGIAADSEVMAHALGGPVLEMTMRGTTVAVMASATPTEGGCAAQVVAHAPGAPQKWSRLFRWSDVAWTGAAADGRLKVVFYEHEGRLPGDTLVFAPRDGATFRAALTRVVDACRTMRARDELVLASQQGPSRSCYFARLPQLQLHASNIPAHLGGRQQALLTLISRENPEAELQLLLDPSAFGASLGANEPASPGIAFIYANHKLRDLRIASASFELDAQPVRAPHAIAAFGDTRLRIAMDSRRPPAGSLTPGAFSRRLSASGEVKLTLHDSTRAPRAVLHFDIGPALDAARAALRSADWSCGAPTPAPVPAARWRPHA